MQEGAIIKTLLNMDNLHLSPLLLSKRSMASDTKKKGPPREGLCAAAPIGLRVWTTPKPNLHAQPEGQRQFV